MHSLFEHVGKCTNLFEHAHLHQSLSAAGQAGDSDLYKDRSSHPTILCSWISERHTQRGIYCCAGNLMDMPRHHSGLRKPSAVHRRDEPYDHSLSLHNSQGLYFLGKSCSYSVQEPESHGYSSVAKNRGCSPRRPQVD